MMKNPGTQQNEQDRPAHVGEPEASSLTSTGLVCIFLRGSKRWFALAAILTSLVSLLSC